MGDMLHSWHPLTYADGFTRSCDAMDLFDVEAAPGIQLEPRGVLCEHRAVVRVEGPERRHLCPRHAAEEYPAAWAALVRFERERGDDEEHEKGAG